MERDEAETISEKVEYILENFPHTRDNDQKLMVMVWEIFYSQHIVKGMVALETIPTLPAENTIRRARANIQNCRGEYPPTEWVQAKKRGWRRDDWERIYGVKKKDNAWPSAWLISKGLKKINPKK